MKLIKISFFILIIFCQLLTGQSFQELQKLQNEYKNALERQSLQKPKDISDAEKIVNSGALPDKLVYSRKDIESLLVNTDKLLQQLKFYDDSLKKMPYIGYDFFTKRDSISFWQNFLSILSSRQSHLLHEFIVITLPTSIGKGHEKSWPFCGRSTNYVGCCLGFPNEGLN